MPGKLPAMMLYVSDFLGDNNVQEMDFYEKALYIRLLMCCHQEEDDTIPEDPKRLAAKVGLPVDDFLKFWPIVKERFRPADNKPGYITHPRIGREKERYRITSEERSKAAKAGWEQRRAKSGNGPTPTFGPTKDFTKKTELVVTQDDAVAMEAALRAGAGTRIDEGALTPEQANVLAEYDIDTLRLLGEHIGDGGHWLTVKNGEEVLSLRAIVNCNLAGAVEDARAWEKRGRKPPRMNGHGKKTGMADPRPAATVTEEVKL